MAKELNTLSKQCSMSNLKIWLGNQSISSFFIAFDLQFPLAKDPPYHSICDLVIEGL
jgi:hypothetical protein